MGTNRQHLTTVIATIHSNYDALPFFLGFLLSEIPEPVLCQALAAWTEHLRQLEELQAPGLALVQVEESNPGD